MVNTRSQKRNNTSSEQSTGVQVVLQESYIKRDGFGSTDHTCAKCGQVELKGLHLRDCPSYWRSRRYMTASPDPTEDDFQLTFPAKIKSFYPEANLNGTTGRLSQCYKCGEEGHFGNACPAPIDTRDPLANDACGSTSEEMKSDTGPKSKGSGVKQEDKDE